MRNSYCFVNSFETLAIARNIEDIAAERITPMVPVIAAQRVSAERFASNSRSSVSPLNVPTSTFKTNSKLNVIV